MSKLYMSLDNAVEQVIYLSRWYGDLSQYGAKPTDREWLRNELEQVCELRSCKYCRGVEYSEEPFPVTTHMGQIHEIVFNFCPVCGRDLRPDEDEKEKRRKL